MTPGEFGNICGQIFASLLLGFIISCFYKDKKKKIIAFVVYSSVFLLMIFNPLSRGRQISNTYRVNQNIPNSYKANISEQKSIEIKSQDGKFHVSRTDGTNAQQVFLDNCTLSQTEKYTFENNMEFQKAFILMFSIESTYSSLRELSKKCYNIDLLNTQNRNKLLLDDALQKNKEIIIKHLGQEQFECFEHYVLKEFNERLAPAAAGAMYSYLQQQTKGRISVCSLLKDKSFQAEMFFGLWNTNKKVIDNNDKVLWNNMFNPNMPEQNSFDVHMTDNGAYMTTK